METEAITARLPKDEVERLDELAEADERSRSYMLKKAVRFYLDHHDDPRLDGPEPPPKLISLPVPAAERLLRAEPFPSLYAPPLGDGPVAEANPDGSPKSIAELYPEDEDEPELKNFDPTPDDLQELIARRDASKSIPEIEELDRQIGEIQSARMVEFLKQAMPEV